MKTILRSLFLLTAIIWLPLMNIAKAGAQELQTGNEIVIIDPDLQDGNTLINALNPGTKWFFLDRSEQLVPFVSDILSRYAPVKSLHLVTHGMPGAIFTTGTFLNNEITEEEQAEIKRWKNNFSTDGSILLYGCEAGKGPEGKAFCLNLSEISGLNVSASIDKTGSATLGGDWDLELSTGSIEIQTCFSSAITSYNQLLEKVLIWTGPVTGNFYCNSLKTFYNNQAGHSAIQMIDKGTTIPDLSAYSMVFAILPERTLNSTEIKNLKDLLDKGGRIVWVGEHSGYVSMNNVITAAVAALGGHLSIQPLLLDKNSTYLPGTHINMSSPIMKGVTRLYGNAVSGINIGGDATILVKMHDDTTKILMAQEKIGKGDIIAWADINQWDKINDASFGTATFFRNLLSGTIERIQSRLVAKVILSDLVQTYTGSPLPVTIITDPAGLKTNVTYNGSETTPANAGTYTVVATIDDPTYKGTTTGSLKIGKASLNITADDKIRTYGESDPDLSVSYAGFVKGDDIDDLDAKPKASTGANLNSDAGVYDITVFDGSDNNYSYIFNKGSLTIDKGNQVITFKNIPADLRSQQEYQLVATSTSGLPVSFNSSESTIASISGNNMNVGKEGNVRIIASQEGNQNWNPAPDVIQTIITLQAFNKIRSLFTPNNDGMNDYWVIPDIEQYGDLSVKIFNRFGKLLYESSAYNNDWDGTYNGAPLPSASYSYIIKSVEKGIIKGIVNMVR